MGWKDWPLWIKSALLFSLLSIVISILALIFFQTTFEEVLIVSAPTYFIFIFQFMRPDPPTTSELTYVYSIIVITSAILWFIIGSLFGWIYGKIKQKITLSSRQTNFCIF